MNGNFLSDLARKYDIAGKLMYTLCHDLVSHGSGEKKDLKKHTLKKKHLDAIKLKKTNTTLPSSFGAAQEVICSLPYSAFENGHCEAPSVRKHCQKLSFQDRLMHTESFLLSFLAENCLPFIMAP